MDLHDIFRKGWQWANEQMIKFWILLQDDMDRAGQLRASGQALTGCGQYAVDCVQPKCAELERLCADFTTQFNNRRSRLHKAQLTWRAVLHVRSAVRHFTVTGSDWKLSLFKQALSSC